MMEDVVKGRIGAAVHSVNNRILAGLLLSCSERKLCGFLVMENPILNVSMHNCYG
jgi:hypothetical protein